MNEDLLLIKQLEDLRAQHHELDDRIDHDHTMDEFTRQRLKRERLRLQDKIAELEQIVYPDIIA